MRAKRLITFSAEMLRKLKEQAKRREVSVSELVRRIIDRWLERVEKIQ